MTNTDEQNRAEGVGEELRAIRQQLRLAMNGVVATSLRESGMRYKLIFGVPLPELRRIASSHAQSEALAEAMWSDDVRELKLLAPMLFPPDNLTTEKAARWIAETPYPEVAEQLSASLLSLAPCGEDIISGCLRGEIAGRYARVAGFLTVANLYIKGKELSPAGEELFLVEARREMDAGVSAEQRAALLAVKRYGRGAEERRRRVEELVADYAECGRAEQEEFYADIRFEFEYYG